MPDEEESRETQPPPATAALTEDDVKRLLKRFRTARTLRRKQFRADVAKVENLHGANPRFTADCPPGRLLELVSQHATRCRELDDQIAALIDEDLMEAEATTTEEFNMEMDQIVASIKLVINRASARPRAFDTFHGTPIAKAVHFIPRLSTTLGAQSFSPMLTRRGAIRTPAAPETEENPNGPITTATVSPPDMIAQPAVSAPTRLARELDISPEIFSGDRLRFRAFITQFGFVVAERPESLPVERA